MKKDIKKKRKLIPPRSGLSSVGRAFDCRVSSFKNKRFHTGIKMSVVRFRQPGIFSLWEFIKKKMIMVFEKRVMRGPIYPQASRISK